MRLYILISWLTSSYRGANITAKDNSEEPDLPADVSDSFEANSVLALYIEHGVDEQ